MGCRISVKQFDTLMREYRIDRLLSQEEELSALVPESTDRAAERAFEQMRLAVATGAPVSFRPTKAAGASLGAKAAAIAVSAAVLAGAGTCAISPAAREYAVRAISAVIQSVQPEKSAARQPGAYIIPSPGEDFTVTDESQSERMTAKWFAGGRRQMLVEIAYKLPDELVKTEDIEYVTVGGLPGTLYETEGMELLVLRDGSVYILIEYFNAGREALMEYAEALLAQNAGEQEYE